MLEKLLAIIIGGGLLFGLYRAYKENKLPGYNYKGTKYGKGLYGGRKRW